MPVLASRRTVLGIAPSAAHSNEVAGAKSFGVFRM
jgi:hypothetical protein